MTDPNSLRAGAGYALEAGLYATYRAMTEAADTIDTLRAQLAEQEDMAAVGRALMEAVKTYAPKHWHPNDCPSEIVGDLANECDELRVRLANAKEDREITYLTGVAVGKKGCEEQLAEAQRDAERWRYLRDSGDDSIYAMRFDVDGDTPISGADLDVSIDAAKESK